MGRGDRRTKKGKTFSGSYGVARKHEFRTRAVREKIVVEMPAEELKPTAVVKEKAAPAEETQSEQAS